MKTNQLRLQKAVIFAMLSSAYLGNALLAQANPPSTIPAHASSSTKETAPAMASCSAYLLLSSPAAMALVKKEQLLESQAFPFVKAGDELAKTGDWQGAQGQYQQALDIEPNPGLAHMLAIDGMIAFCRATGDTTKGLEYSRQAIYIHGIVAEGYAENDISKLMQFALLLQKTGQNAEAIQVYNHAAYALDYRDGEFNGGKPYLEVLLPEIVTDNAVPGQHKYTPECLQALANTALAHEEMAFGNDKEALAHMREAVKLYPDSPVTHYYLGEALLTKDGAGAKAAYQKAIDLGDDSTIAAAKERLKMIP